MRSVVLITWSFISLISVISLYHLVNYFAVDVSKEIRARKSKLIISMLWILYILGVFGNGFLMWFQNKELTVAIITFGLFGMAGIPITLAIYRNKSLELLNQLQSANSPFIEYLNYKSLLRKNENKTFGYPKKTSVLASFLHMYFIIGIFFLIVFHIFGISAFSWEIILARI